MLIDSVQGLFVDCTGSILPPRKRGEGPAQFLAT